MRERKPGNNYNAKWDPLDESNDFEEMPSGVKEGIFAGKYNIQLSRTTYGWKKRDIVPTKDVYDIDERDHAEMVNILNKDYPQYGEETAWLDRFEFVVIEKQG